MLQMGSFCSQRPVDALKAEVSGVRRWKSFETAEGGKQPPAWPSVTLRYRYSVHMHACLCVCYQCPRLRKEEKFYGKELNNPRNQIDIRKKFGNYNSSISHSVPLVCLLKDDQQEQLPKNWSYLDPCKNTGNATLVDRSSPFSWCHQWTDQMKGYQAPSSVIASVIGTCPCFSDLTIGHEHTKINNILE